MLSENRDVDHCSSVNLCPVCSVLRRFIKHGLEMGMQGFAHSLIALRGQVKVIVHILMGDATVGVDKAWVDIEERGMREKRYGFLDQLVHFGISVPQRVWHFSPR